MPIQLAHAIVKRLAQVRKDGTLPYLRPDGKSQVTVEYRYGKPVRLHTVVVAAQHEADATHEQIERESSSRSFAKWCPQLCWTTRPVTLSIAPDDLSSAAPWATPGSPAGRSLWTRTGNGPSRRRRAFLARITKVDRSGSYAVRWIAKNVVAAGLADRCQIQIAYTIGVARPVALNIETFGTGRIPDAAIEELVNAHFDLRPGAIIRDLRLRRPIYKPTAAYGHFGRTDIDAPWENTDRAAALRSDAGL